MANAFELYLLCREVQFITLRLEKDKGRKVVNNIAPFVVGFAQLPEPGGVLDQGVWMLGMFEAFRSGENANAIERLNKS